MESVFGRYRNISILVGILFLQVLGLAVQVKRNVDDEPTRLIRIWTVNAVTPLEKGIVAAQNGVHNLWHNYFYLRGVRQENRDLKAEIERLRLEQVRLSEDAEQARRLQVLLGFKEQYISRTVAAQVIGSSGSEQSRSVYIDKGSDDGLRPDMAVITADGIVGKVLRVFRSTAQVLLINDQTSGVGAILEKSRLQGVLRGSPAGEVVLEKVMADETVQSGEPVLTSGGDRIFPKGLPVGQVTKVSTGPELFLSIRVKPAANLSKLEEVLVVTKMEEKQPQVEQTGPVRAVDILAERLPSVPVKPADANTSTTPPGSASKPNTEAASNPKPQSAAAQVPAQKANTSTTVGNANIKPATAVSGQTASPNSVKSAAKQPPGDAKGIEATQSSAPVVPTKPTLQPTSGQKPAVHEVKPGETDNPAAVKPATQQPKPQPTNKPVQPPPTAPEGQPH